MKRRFILSPAWLLGLSLTLGVFAVLAAVAIWTTPVRASVQTYTALIAAANLQDLDRAKSLCTPRYLAAHPLKPAVEGGLVGLPRGIHPNFKVWQEGANVWLCPRNRIGPVYQFVLDDREWKFDGLVGLLRSGGEFIPFSEGANPDDLLLFPED